MIGRRHILAQAALVVLLGAFQAWIYRHGMNEDGISYLDMADAILRDGPAALVHGYWSPLYPALIAIVFGIASPQGVLEFSLVHLLNFVVYLWAFWCFTQLYRATLGAEEEKGCAIRRVLAYSLFVWASLETIALQVVTPDLLLSSFVYLAFAILVHGWRDVTRATPRASIALGSILGCAALTKSVFFVLSPVFLAVWAMLLLRQLPRPTALRRAMLAAVMFAVVGGPLVVALSVQKGRFTFGDNGRLAYSELVNDVPRQHWRGQTPGSGSAEHPTRLVHAAPAAYEFATPFIASYPPWYDASYWYEGVKPKWQPERQWRTIATSLRQYLEWFAGFVPLLILVPILLRQGVITPSRSGLWTLGLPASAALVLYGIVYTEPRYVGHLLAATFLVMLASVQSAADVGRRTIHALMLTTAAVCALVTAEGLASSALAAREVRARGGDAQQRIASELQRVGVQRGQRLGIVGAGISAFWVRLAGVNIGTEIVDRDAFWKSSPDARESALSSMLAAGATHIVADHIPALADTSGWTPLGSTGAWLYTRR